MTSTSKKTRKTSKSKVLKKSTVREALHDARGFIRAGAIGAAGLTLWVSCITSSLNAPSTSVLDGQWKEVSVGCVGGPPASAENRVNDALQSGQVTSNMSIVGGVATTSIRTYTNKEKTGGYCDITMVQRWNEIGSHVEVADVSIKQHGQEGNKCQGSPEVHDPRVHNFAVKGDKLTMYMNSTISINSAGTYSAVKPTECPNGEPQVVVFERNR